MIEFDINSAPLEIERKYLIRYPDINALKKEKDYRVIHIEQSYLKNKSGRIRKITENGNVRYIFTFKKKISDITRHEFEREISKEEYITLLKDKREDSVTIIKDRHIFSYGELTYELDVYDFWDDKATLEAEVKSEDTVIPIPPCVSLIKEVTYDKRYSNSRLSVNRGVIEDNS